MDELSGLPLALLFEEVLDKKKDEMRTRRRTSRHEKNTAGAEGTSRVFRQGTGRQAGREKLCRMAVSVSSSRRPDWNQRS